MKKLTHEEFLEDLLKVNEYYQNGEFEILSVYKHIKDPMLIKNKIGVCKLIPENLLSKKCKGSVLTAIDKQEYFKTELLLVNEHYRNGEFEIVGNTKNITKITQDMNQIIKKINLEKVLFFDLEVVRKNNELDVNSKEYGLYQKKTRNRDNDEVLEHDALLEHYNQRAGLKMVYNKVVSVGIGMVKDDVVYLKALEGNEEELIKQFCEIAQSFDYLAGANILEYDLPLLSANGYKYFDVCETLPDRFVVNNKKPWEMKSVIDLIMVFKGTHYANSSLDEICYHFDLASPKTDLDGSMVSTEYYTNGLEKINQYVKQDVFASINVFQKMRFQKPFSEFVDRNQNTAQKQEEIFTKPHILERINNSPNITEDQKTELIKLLSKTKIVKKDLPIIREILEKIFISCEMFKADSPALVAKKKEEIDNILKQFT